MGQAVLVAVLSGALIVGARTAGTYAGQGLVKLVHALHHVSKPIGHAAKKVAKHQVTDNRK